jgi:hypothetical protein
VERGLRLRLPSGSFRSWFFPDPDFESRFVLPLRFSLLLTPLFARCPVSNNATVIVHAPIGNLLVDTTGTDAVDVEVSNKQVTAQEATCRPDLVRDRRYGAGAVQWNGDWKIRVPKGANLDLVTLGGNITMAIPTGTSR